MILLVRNKSKVLNCKDTRKLDGSLYGNGRNVWNPWFTTLLRPEVLMVEIGKIYILNLTAEMRFIPVVSLWISKIPRHSLVTSSKSEEFGPMTRLWKCVPSKGMDLSIWLYVSKVNLRSSSVIMTSGRPNRLIPSYWTQKTHLLKIVMNHRIDYNG